MKKNNINTQFLTNYERLALLMILQLGGTSHISQISKSAGNVLESAFESKWIIYGLFKKGLLHRRKEIVDLRRTYGGKIGNFVYLYTLTAEGLHAIVADKDFWARLWRGIEISQESGEDK